MSCAPGVTKKVGKNFETCLSVKDLQEILMLYNKQNNTNIRIGKTVPSLVKTLQNIMFPTCRTDQLCWAETVRSNAIHAFRPRMPDDWDINKHEWLSNFDIIDCLSQYAETYPFYKFVGVFSSDFAEKDFGSCLMEKACSIPLKDIGLYGLVINTDVSTGRGQHWVSLLICTDPKKSQYGFSYYDSIGNPIIPGVQKYIEEIRIRNPFMKNAPFYDMMKGMLYTHQVLNSECGMFCIIHHHCMIKSYENDLVKPMDYKNIDLSDDIANAKRDFMFSKSRRSYMKS